jgi:small nuclear ribonucleoprotein G
MPQAQPELKKVTHTLPYHSIYTNPSQDTNTSNQQYLDKRVEVQLNGSRKVMGTLRGYDVFLNIVLDEATESKPNNEKVRLGMCVIRGNAVVMLEALDRIDTDNRNRG